MGGKKRGFSKNGNGPGGRTVCPRGLSFSEFIVLMSTINSEKDSPLGQTVLPPGPFPFFENPRFFPPTLYSPIYQPKNLPIGDWVEGERLTKLIDT